MHGELIGLPVNAPTTEHGPKRGDANKRADYSYEKERGKLSGVAEYSGVWDGEFTERTEEPGGCEDGE